MITDSDVALVGKINKTHGINGELSISFFDDDLMDMLEVGDCLILSVEGIYTPFFINSVRPRGAETLLISFDGLDSQEAAAPYVGMSVYADADMVKDDSDDDDSDGLYAGQLIGYAAQTTDGIEIGEIIDIDESTENVLFIIQGDKGIEYVPVVDDFIDQILTKEHIIIFDLPEGLLQN